MFEKYDKAVSKYIANMYANGLAENTVESYQRTFRMLRESMERNGYEEVSADAVLDFKAEMGSVKVTTQALYMTHIRILSGFAVEFKFVDEPFYTSAMKPASKKLASERKKPYEHVLTDKDMEALITAERPAFGRKPRTWLREKAEVTLLLQSGLRNSELRSLRLCDLDWENGVAYPQSTKGDKPRAVLFSEASQNAVRAYLDSGLRPEYVADDDFLFGTVGADGAWKQMERSKLSERVRYYTASVLGEEKACRTHAARHCYASVLLENDVPMEMISETMGHSSVATTKIYAARFSVNAPALAVARVFNK